MEDLCILCFSLRQTDNREIHCPLFLCKDIYDVGKLIIIDSMPGRMTKHEEVRIVDSILKDPSSRELMDSIAMLLYEIVHSVIEMDYDLLHKIDEVEIKMYLLAKNENKNCVLSMINEYKSKRDRMKLVIMDKSISNPHKTKEIIEIVHDINNANMICWLQI